MVHLISNIDLRPKKGDIVYATILNVSNDDSKLNGHKSHTLKPIHYGATTPGPTLKTSTGSESSSSSSSTIMAFVGMVIIAAAFYVTFQYFWRKHRKRSIATLYKIDEYRYSRLTQNEADGENAVLYGDPNSQILDPLSDDEDEGKPATLLVEPVSVVGGSAQQRNQMNVSQGTMYKASSQVEQPLISVSDTSGDSNDPSRAALLLQDSDEDLLQ